MTNPAQDNDQTQSGLTDLINALKGQALNMGALTQAFQALSTALTNALARIYTVFVGDSGSGGVKGLVPAPAAGDAAANKFLKASGGWAVINNPSASAAWRREVPSGCCPQLSNPNRYGWKRLTSAASIG